MKGNIITKGEMLAIPANEISAPGRLELNPLVRVIFVNYNHEKYIAEAI